MTVTRTGPGVAKLVTKVREFDGLEGKTGWFENNLYPDGTAIAYVATIHEFGAGPIPARSFMRTGVAEYGQQWLDHLAEGARVSLLGGPSPEQVLDLVAKRAAQDVGEHARTVTSPALAPATVKRKGFSQPLVDTGWMLQSITGKVEKT